MSESLIHADAKNNQLAQDAEKSANEIESLKKELYVHWQRTKERSQRQGKNNCF